MIFLGFSFWRRNNTAEEFTAAGRSLPGWLCGMSIFATYLSSISYLALPGKSFASNWNAFAFSLALPLAAWIAVRYFLPMYRASGEVSAYALLEQRFGVWARLLASSLYLLFQIARTGIVMYLMALPMSILFGWDIRVVIVVTGIIVTLYSLVGGITAVIWADAIQAIVLLVGALFALAILILAMPNGFGSVIENGDKFSLGKTSFTIWDQPTLWIVLAYGLFENLKNFGIDQSYVQRYIASESDKEAAKSIWLGAMLYIPVSALFLFIGTSLHSFYHQSTSDLSGVKEIVARQQLLQNGADPNLKDFGDQVKAQASTLQDKDIGDRVFPHFIASHLPVGVRGLLIAAVFAAAMSTVSTGLNSSATLVLSDFFEKLRPNPSSAVQMRVLRISTIVWGALGTVTAVILVRSTESALDIWWTLSGILGAAIVGLFLAGVTVPRLGRHSAKWVMSAGLLVVAWMTLSQSDLWPEEFGWAESPLHKYLTIVVGPCVMMILAFGLSVFNRTPQTQEPE